MRKSILAGVAALGFLAIGMTVMAPTVTRQADAEGSGAAVRATPHIMLAQADLSRSKAPTCVDVGTC